MRTYLNRLCVILIGAYLLSSCGTLIGGSRYYAHVEVKGRPEAQIYYRGVPVGKGAALLKLKRAHANRLSLLVKQDGCEDQVFTFQSRTFRGVPLVVDLLWALPYVVVSGVFLIVDLGTGSYWKPNSSERGIEKMNYKNYHYTLDYHGCPVEQKLPEPPKQDQDSVLIDHVYLKNGSIIKGTVVEMVPNVQIKIETRDGSIFVYKMEEVEKMTKEKVVRKGF